MNKRNNPSFVIILIFTSLISMVIGCKVKYSVMGFERYCKCKEHKTVNVADSLESVYGKKSNNCGKLWAVIIVGLLDNNGIGKALAKDADGMYSILLGHGVEPGNIYYFKSKRCKDKLQYDGSVDCKMVSMQSIEDNVFTKIKNNEIKINPEDKFLFFINTHGGEDTLSLCDDPETDAIKADKLNEWLEKIKCKKIFIIINACNSGSFVGEIKQSIKSTEDNSWDDDLIAPCMCNNRIAITSCRLYEDSNGDVDNKCDSNPTDRGSEFMGGFIEAFTKEEADIIDQDQRISIGEAFNYAQIHAACGESSEMESPNCPPCFKPIIKCSKGIDISKEFLFWDD